MNNNINLIYDIIINECNTFIGENETNEDKIIFYNNNQSLFNDEFIQFVTETIELTKNVSSCQNIKQINTRIINNDITFSLYSSILNETDKTTVGLLYHENIIDVINKNKNSISIYLKMLDNFCFADYIDRITFQKQIWYLNELSSIIKIYNNNKILFNHCNVNDTLHLIPSTLINTRFTKILTKYSTEYNNIIFINELCQKLGLNVNDLFSFFIIQQAVILTKINMNNYDTSSPVYFNCTNNLSKIDIKRMYRYINTIYGYSIVI
jgi:hypothetical protein